MDDTLLYLIIGFVVSALYFEFRVRHLMRHLAPQALEGLKRAFFTQDVVRAEDGTERVVWRANSVLEAMASAVAPVFLAAMVKSVKLGAPKGGLPPGVDLSNLAEALPAILGSGLVPKKYAGLLAIAAPFLANLGKGGPAKPKAGSQTVPKELEL